MFFFNFIFKLYLEALDEGEEVLGPISNLGKNRVLLGKWAHRLRKRAAERT